MIVFRVRELFTIVIFCIGLCFSCTENSLLLQQGDVLEYNGICIEDIFYPKTSLTVVIPPTAYARIIGRSDRNWDNITAANVDEIWRGVFINGRCVTLGAYALGTYPVTQELYSAVMGENPSHFIQGSAELRPVDTVTWFNAVVFCNALTKKTMKLQDCVYYSDKECSVCYTAQDAEVRSIPFMDMSRTGYRLPTEAEWEYAARGGREGSRDWRYAYAGIPTETGGLINDGDHYIFMDSNLDQFGWYLGNSGGSTHEVGTKLPNRLGIYDMSGNVWEWLWDWYDARVYQGVYDNPTGAETGTDRVLRGGSWYNYAFTCSVTRRFHNAHPYIPHFYFGFRICRSL